MEAAVLINNSDLIFQTLRDYSIFRGNFPLIAKKALNITKERNEGVKGEPLPATPGSHRTCATWPGLEAESLQFKASAFLEAR